MKNSTLKLAFGALLLIGIPAVWLAWRDGSRWFADAAAADAQLAAPGLVEAPERVVRLEIAQAEDRLVVERDASGAWSLPDKGGFPAKEDAVMKLVRGLADLELVEAKTAVPERHEKIGLVAPADGGEVARLVRALDAAGEPVAELLLGDRFYESTFPALFVRRPGEDQTWLARGEVVGQVAARDWMERGVLNLEREEVREARMELLEPAGEGYITSRETPEAFDFELAEVPEGREPAAGYLVSGLGRLPQSLRFEDVAPAGSIELTGAEHRRATFETFDGLLVTLDAHRLPAEADAARPTWIQLAFGLTETAGQAPAGPPAPATEGEQPELAPEPEGPTRAELEARVAELSARTSAWIYQVETGTATALLRSVEDLTQDPAEAAAAEGANPLESLSQEELQALVEQATQNGGG